jgi:hypothetical protein
MESPPCRRGSRNSSVDRQPRAASDSQQVGQTNSGRADRSAPTVSSRPGRLANQSGLTLTAMGGMREGVILGSRHG